MDYTYEKAKKIAAGLVATRMYTCREIEDRLRRKKIDSEIAEKVVGDFVGAGILNDFEYAKLYIEEAVRLGGKGMYRIRQELYAKGVARAVIDDACDNCEEDTLAAICEYVESHRLCEGITTRKDLEKLKARLARRGFSSAEIRECLSNYEFTFESDDEYL